MSDFSTRLIAWQKKHGRHDLPWQKTTNPYAIWVSEIMLQQTQVVTAVGYYRKFMRHFPDIARLARATQDEVLQYWSGLGYYSRARNLHDAAVIIMDEHGGVFPQDFEMIQTLPGIGRSTAAAIASFAFNQRQAILDGNVKRVLARYFLVEGWTGQPKVEKTLWTLAESSLPEHDIVAYTQGLMDLGASLCSRNKPKCTTCPLNDDCGAYRHQRVHELPTPKARKEIPEKRTIMLILQRGDEVMLEKRPPTGIWGGLWSFPEAETNADIEAAVLHRFNVSVQAEKPLPMFSHTFTHFKLHIQPQPLQVLKLDHGAREAGQVWISLEDALGAAVPTPVRKILRYLRNL